MAPIPVAETPAYDASFAVVFSAKGKEALSQRDRERQKSDKRLERTGEKNNNDIHRKANTSRRRPLQTRRPTPLFFYFFPLSLYSPAMLTPASVSPIPHLLHFLCIFFFLKFSSLTVPFPRSVEDLSLYFL